MVCGAFSGSNHFLLEIMLAQRKNVSAFIDICILSINNQVKVGGWTMYTKWNL